jgi:outer membrane protein assembly factor BamB
MTRSSRGRIAALGVASILAVLGVAGCGGGGDAATVSSTGETPTTGLKITVVDGDTRAPIPGASVAALGGDGSQVGPAATTDAVGHATLPSNTAVAYATIPTHSPDSRTILPGRNEATIPLYQPQLQSPEYGGGPARTRYVPAVDVPPPSGPPAWQYRGKALLEFPPAVARGNVVLTTNRGRIIVFNARTGGVKWQKKHSESSYIASSPAILPDERRVIVSGMDGRLVAYELVNGREAWEYSTGSSPIESSPLVVGQTVYVGAWNGRLYAVATSTGRPRWSFPAADDIKGSAAQAGDLIVFGDYSGTVYGVRASDGTEVWRRKLGKRFYGGPAVQGDVAVIGDVGGAVVAFRTSNGQQLWRHSTGGAFVYSSPAIANGTVFIGSYSGKFEALNLANGKVRWAFDAGGRISGSGTVVGDTVYMSVLARRGEPDRTYGLDVATGKKRWTGNDGRYSPAVGAGRTLYIVGRTTLYAYPAP